MCIYEFSRLCNVFTDNGHQCIEPSHMLLETRDQNIGRVSHHAGLRPCDDDIPCLGKRVPFENEAHDATDVDEGISNLQIPVEPEHCEKQTQPARLSRRPKAVFSTVLADDDIVKIDETKSLTVVQAKKHFPRLPDVYSTALHNLRKFGTTAPRTIFDIS